MKFKILVLIMVKTVMDYFVRPVIRFGYSIYYRKIDHTKPLPKCNNPLIFTPAHKLAKMIRNKEITSLELVEAYINRIKEINPYVNCVVAECYDKAIEEAKNVDKILSSSTISDKYSDKNAPLLGVPFSCKECLWVEGMPNSTGCFARVNFRAPKDADVVRYLRQAGAILTCLTNTSEVCMWFESNNYLYGTTRNPYNLSRIVGGSSGGEGCIVSSTGAVFGVGSDIGGSIRMPAFFNGVYGHKPSVNLISNYEQFPSAKGLQENMLGTGPICRYASDLKLLVKVFSGPKFEEVAHNFETPVDLKKYKYYCIRDLGDRFLYSQPSEDTKNALNKAINCVEKNLGVRVKELNLPKLRLAFGIWSAMMSNGVECSNSFGKLLTNSDVPINPYKELLKSIFGLQKNHTMPAIGLAIVERIPNKHVGRLLLVGNELRSEIRNILGEDGVLLFPSFPIVAPYHNMPMWTNTFDYIYYGIINALGLPSTQCPMGLSPCGLPTGVQVVSNHNMDHVTISLAELFEQKLGGWVSPF